MEIFKVENLYHHALCVYLRTVIFIQEQDVSVEEEIEQNEDDAVCFLGLVDGKAVATARYRIIDNNLIAKIERVGVLNNFRGKGYGNKLMDYVIEDAKLVHNPKVIKLSSQDHAIPFYENLGFAIEGDGFMEADIPHHMMILDNNKDKSCL